jgi:2,4-dienoyl-CoA reductase-like NADH-dependent reductase (Old Yellow Enzyme family)
MPHEMTIQEVRSFVPAFAHAAMVAVQAGCDGVELHGAHGYLFTEFLSPNSNRRTDEYGGSMENRMRFPIEVIKAVRAAVGSDYPVGMRISADEFVYGGYTLDDMLVMAPLLVKAGLDWVNVSSGTYASPATAIEPMYLPLNSFVYCAAAIKQVVDVPVFARGRIQDPVQAEEIIANNQADGVSMVREIVVDPDFCNKAKDGRLEEIRKCLACNEGCWGNISRQRVIVPGGMVGGMGCTMNPAIGLETQPGWDDLIPANQKKNVMVIGGGPAGLEAARVAAAASAASSPGVFSRSRAK